jgi:hypothetical protein
MNAHRWLTHVVMRTMGSVRGASGRHSARPTRARVARGVLMVALVLGSLGAVVAVSAGHSAGHAGAPRVSSLHKIPHPWMY